MVRKPGEGELEFTYSNFSGSGPSKDVWVFSHKGRVYNVSEFFLLEQEEVTEVPSLERLVGFDETPEVIQGKYVSLFDRLQREAVENAGKYIPLSSDEPAALFKLDPWI